MPEDPNTSSDLLSQQLGLSGALVPHEVVEPPIHALVEAQAPVGVAVLAAGLAWRPTVAAVASVVLVVASCVFIT